MKDEIGKVIIGQHRVIELLLMAIFSRGHCLLVGVPGLAKTLMVKTLARATSLSFKRIQFTPDLMPTDITGTNIIQEEESGKRVFRFVQGPLFANIVLADEINRTPPKTQAALLEAMQEHQITSANQTYPLPHPFLVIATQNPIEQEGTYPLPEAQLDRFMFCIDLSYPELGEEEDIYLETTRPGKPETEPVLTGNRILRIQKLLHQVVISRYIVSYVAAIVRATRPKDQNAPPFIRRTVEWGAGPRAGQYLILGAKAIAAMEGRPFVSCEDVRKIAVPVLKHRIAGTFEAQMQGLTTTDIVNKLLSTIPEPKVPKYKPSTIVVGE